MTICPTTLNICTWMFLRLLHLTCLKFNSRFLWAFHISLNGTLCIQFFNSETWKWLSCPPFHPLYSVNSISLRIYHVPGDKISSVKTITINETVPCPLGVYIPPTPLLSCWICFLNTSSIYPIFISNLLLNAVQHHFLPGTVCHLLSLLPFITLINQFTTQQSE